jgi:type I restriction-modification system DNA methylase subunit
MYNADTIKDLKALVSKFSANIDQYKKAKYDESNTRTDFIDKFFALLGWDIANDKCSPEAYRDVVREYKVKINGTKKAPDYCFRVGGVRKFFVEAKKPSVNIKEDTAPAYQLRRYAHTAKLPLSILTDFEEFAVYDARYKPNKNDKADFARIHYWTYNEYEENFDEIYNLFSKEAVENGRLNKFIEKKIKGISEVDEELLALIEKWRVNLVKNIAINNKNLSEFDLNTVVQLIIDRIVFLRIAEDRGMEDEDQLFNTAKKENVYKELIGIFTEANKKYNSGLFVNVDWINKVHIKDDVLSNIIVNLYYPESPYEFSVLPVEILGSIYERFLGKTIRFRNIKGDTHTAIVEEKPEVKKAGGVFYTPQYIVDYIVKNTVGEKIKNKTPEEISKIKICDPACGSGSFLICAYQYLLDYHLNYYTQAEKVESAKKNAQIYETCVSSSSDKEKIDRYYNLTIEEKQRILTSSIFGVDIDNQAVEVTKLSLYLKLLENESSEVSDWLIQYSDRTLLPSLEENIKCGNSLIGQDYYAQGNFDFDDKDDKVNGFDWDKGFVDIFKSGGFDVVIGNPPYGADFSQQEREYLHHIFKIPNYQYDSYLFFIEKNIKLLKQDGQLGLIIPNTWLLNLTAVELRKYLFSNIQIEKIAHYLNKVFKDAVVDTEIIIFRNSVNHHNDIEINVYNKDEIIFTQQINQKKLIDLNGLPVNILERKEYQTIKEKAGVFPKLDVLCKITQGTKPFQVGKGKPPQTKKIVESKPYVSENKNDDAFVPLLRGSMMNKYQIIWENNYWIKFGDWLAEPRYSASYDKEKIIIRQTGDSLIATYDKEKFVVRDNLYTIVNIPNLNISLKYILGIINSKFLNWYYQNIINNEKGEALAQVKRGHLAVLPIPALDLSQKADKEKHDKLVSLVDKMLELKQKEASEQNQLTKTKISRQIEGINEAIDVAVYGLYGLSEDEIKVVEG